MPPPLGHGVQRLKRALHLKARECNLLGIRGDVRNQRENEVIDRHRPALGPDVILREIPAHPVKIGPVVTDLAYVGLRSEEHTSELQSLMRISYAFFCLTKKK